MEGWEGRGGETLFFCCFHRGGEALPKLVQIALCIIEMRAARLIYIIIRYKSFLRLLFSFLCYAMVLLDHFIVLCFLV
jgi:hypothetical protein